jgi:cell division control protein 7
MQALPSSDRFHHQIERAWYVLTVLIRLGRPARPLELDPDPDLLEFLCQIPGSPLLFTDDGYITVSGSAFSCFYRFWSNLSVSSAGRAGARACLIRSQGRHVVALYTRKREVRGYDCMTPVSKKRRLVIGYERGKVPFP